MIMRTNWNRFKEPRGFIKVLQFFVAIFAFATTAGYYSEFKVNVHSSCGNGTRNGTHGEIVKFSYPFDDADYYIDQDACSDKAHKQDKLDANFKSESQFFVFVGVISFLYCIVAMVYYINFEDPAKYGPGGTERSVKSFATVDFCVTLLLVLFWFAGSIAWAAGVSKLKDETDADSYIKKASQCTAKGATCEVTKKAEYAVLTISLLFGFLNSFLWCANIWFVYKETIWHKEAGATSTAEQPSAEIPRQEVPKETP